MDRFGNITVWKNNDKEPNGKVAGIMVTQN